MTTLNVAAHVMVPVAPAGNEGQLDSYNYGTTATYGSNVTAAWTYATGAGVSVALVDDGFTPGLINNFDATDSQSLGTAGLAEPTGGYHGTTTSTLIGGSGVNGTSVGIAPNAAIIGEKVDMGATPLSEFTDALTAATNSGAAVINNSWGFGGYGEGEASDPSTASWYAAVDNAVQTGRNGLGTVVVVAAGNDRADANNVGVQPIADAPQVIAVAASQANGTVATFSNPGAGLLVAMDGSNVAVTLPGGTTALGSGTSYAAPSVSAVTAMMLQANPNLGYRDVQEILADSAYAPSPSAAGFTTNGATTWNGGGMHFSNDLGFGVVDANVAVNLARAWTGQSTSANLDTTTVGQAQSFSVAINGTGVSSVVDASNERVQHVQVSLDDTGLLAANTKLVLTSPDGTQSVLLNNTGLANGTDETGGLDLTGDQITSNAFWGENASGTWTLQVTDTNGTVVGNVQDWSLTVLGDAGAGAAPLVYTPEYALLAAQSDARTVVTPDGTNTIDLIGLTGTTQLNLNGGAGMIDGVGVTVQAGLTTVNADGSTGMLDITAATGGSNITGGAGAMVVYGSGGNDTVVAGSGATSIWSQTDTKMSFIAGAGDSIVHAGVGETDITEGTGANHLMLNAAHGGGLDVITGFSAGLDTVHLSGYAAGTAAMAIATQVSDSAGGSMLSLADGTRIDFAGIGHVSHSVFA
jgi:subtilisin-like proprotein convertase family protein